MTALNFSQQQDYIGSVNFYFIYNSVWFRLQKCEHLKQNLHVHKNLEREIIKWHAQDEGVPMYNLGQFATCTMWMAPLYN